MIRVFNPYAVPWGKALIIAAFGAVIVTLNLVRLFKK
jgi:hypothetical protein